MATYRLVPETEWQAAVEAVDALAKALAKAGTVTLPDVATSPSTRPSMRPHSGSQRKDMKDGVRLAREAISRVDGGGRKHQPKVFDRVGPRIADFVYVLTNSSFTVPDIIDTVSKYVALKEGRREAGGQIRTAVRADARFRHGEGGVYFKEENKGGQ